MAILLQTSDIWRPFFNPPNGSWGMVKIRPTPEAIILLNPPNGSWGMVKIRPTVCQMSF